MQLGLIVLSSALLMLRVVYIFFYSNTKSVWFVLSSTLDTGNIWTQCYACVTLWLFFFL